MSDEQDPLDRLLWIDLPDIDTDMGPFTLDPSVPLPVEPDADSNDVDLTQVSWEKIIAAMLLVLANRPSHEHADYYREFLAALRPNLAAELAEAAEDQIAEDNWERGEEILLALRGLNPNAPDARHALARLYHRRTERERRYGDRRIADSYAAAAEAAYNELLSHEAAARDAWYDAGVFRYHRGDFKRALETLEAYLGDTTEPDRENEARRLVRLCRDEGQADDVYLEAYTALNEGRLADGVRLAEEFKEKRPEGWPGWFLLGWGYRLLEDWAGARKALETAQERGCREPDLYNELAMCARALGDYDASARALENALHHDPNNVKVISNMAVVMMEKGDRSEAIRWIQTALTLDPDYPICRKLLSDWENGD